MSADKKPAENLPDDDHLRNDVAPASMDGDEASPAEHFTPGLTNAGQQVGGLASATGYGEKQDPERPESNNPV